MVKMIVLDLDKTLLNDDGIITDYSMKTLKICMENNIKIAFATARSYDSTLRFIERVKPNIAIMNTGALTIYENKIFDQKPLPMKIANKIIPELFQQKSAGKILIETENEKYRICKSDVENDYKPWEYKKWNIEEPLVNDLLKIRFELFSEDIYLDLKEKYPECDIIHFTNEDWHMVQMKGANKINAIRRIVEKDKISMNNVYAFGDDYNDIDMIRECGIGIAMENGIDEVKNVAKYVCGNNNEDGVAKWIEKYILKNSKTASNKR